MYIDYIDLPKVPEELLENPNDIINKISLDVVDKTGTVIPHNNIQRRAISQDLNYWLKSVCNFPVIAQYLLLNDNSPIHRDPIIRPQAYNYIIVAGGSNVFTTVYDDNQHILKSICIPEKTWYCLDTERLHGVQGIEKNTWRILLSLNKKLWYSTSGLHI